MLELILAAAVFGGSTPSDGPGAIPPVSDSIPAIEAPDDFEAPPRVATALPATDSVTRPANDVAPLPAEIRSRIISVTYNLTASPQTAAVTLPVNPPAPPAPALPAPAKPSPQSAPIQASPQSQAVTAP